MWFRNTHHCAQHAWAVTWDYGENPESTFKQRLTVVHFFSVNFLTPEQHTELIGSPSPATVPFLLA